MLWFTQVVVRADTTDSDRTLLLEFRARDRSTRVAFVDALRSSRATFMSVVLAIDAGTTGVRTVAIDEHGVPGAFAYREFPQHFPRPGWVEHDATEIWAATSATFAEVVAALDGTDGRGGRHHQPARDGRGVGPRDRPPAAPRARVAGPSHRGSV